MISQTELKTQFKISTRYSDKPIDGTGTKQGMPVYPLTKTLVQEAVEEVNNIKTITNYIDKIILAKTTKPIEHDKLRDYQKQDVAAMLRFKRMGLFNEQRLGKTPTVLTTLANIKDEIRTLIIAPKSTHIQWEQETNNWYTNSVKRIRGQKTQRISYYSDASTKVFITTYETAHIDYEYLKNIINCVVLDEAHRIRNYKGMTSKSSPQFTKSIVRLARNSDYVYALTGTPSPNYSHQVFPLLHILYPSTFPSYWGFINYYYSTNTIYTKTGEVEEIGEFQNEFKQQELTEFLNNNCIQRKRKDHMDWLPDTDIKIINLELDKKLRKWYNELYTTWECKELGIDCPNKLTLIHKLLKLSSDMLNGPKTQFILDYIKDYPDEQIIIVTPHTSYLKELHKLIPNSKIMIGDTTTKARGLLKQQFNDKEYQVLLGNVDVIKEGVTLEQGNTIIVVTPSFVCSDNAQAYDRIVPTNKELAITKEKQQIIKLVCKDTIDEYLETQLNLKKSSADIVNNFISYERKENSKSE